MDNPQETSQNEPKRIVIFASGSGTNAENIINYFNGKGFAEVVLVLSNKKDAKVLERAKNHNVPCAVFDRSQLHSENGVLQKLRTERPDLIVLAGFLWKFPELIIAQFPQKIINIHPALLPKYGGKGMYGRAVHENVIRNKEVETGISIHYIDAHYDEGTLIAQKKVTLTPEDTVETVEQKVHALEYKWFPKVIEQILNNSN